MEAGEDKSKIPVKAIVAGLFILAAIFVLAYAGYVYHRNSQRDEALAWAEQNINLKAHIREHSVTYTVTMQNNGGCAITVVESNSNSSTPRACHLNLSQLSASQVKVMDERSDEFPLARYISIGSTKKGDFRCENSLGTFAMDDVQVVMPDEDSANRTANAFKAAIRLCGGKDEPF